MFLVIDGTDKLGIVNLDNLEALRIKEDTESINLDECIVECAMVSGKRIGVFKGTETECSAIVWTLQGLLRSNQEVLQMSQLIPDEQ